jgi:hypothetical protein
MAAITQNADATHALVDWCRQKLDTAETTFDAGLAIARRMGAHKAGESCEVGFWVPELLERRVPDGDIFIEVLEPVEEIHLTVSRQTRKFDRHLVPVGRCEGFVFSVVSGMRAGTRDMIGSFYALTWRDENGKWHRILDPLAHSLPFGVFAPAEYYDLEAMQAARSDKAYFEALPDGDPVKLSNPVNILQIHPGTATAGGTLASLARRFDHLAERVRNNLPLEPADKLFLGYDSVQLMPVEPTTVFETGQEFWTDTSIEGEDETGGVVTAELHRPNTTNWGYDVVVAGMAAVNPAILESGRPDELVDLIEALHNFPGTPKKLVLDVVFGHSDNQGLRALNYHFFAGPNMYGQNINYRHGIVRAILLEMQRRKANFGVDGIRVDGAQDFTFWNSSTDQLEHDDEYLQEMSDVVQEVAGRRYRPWFVFEDGRPWPQEDWELSSTYRAVVEKQRDDDVFQWGPLTFAHNTPFIYSFWLSKWWRIKEIMEVGSNWISGCANHDTLRRGTQINPKLNVNTRLGDTRMEILDKAYDNPAVSLITYCAFPGVPMDFLNASARASWGFIRNQDDQYGVKVVAEEAISLKWQVDEYAYSMPMAFRRLKEMGFTTREDLVRFMEFLPALVEVTNNDLEVIAKLANEVNPPLAGPAPFTVVTLKQVARAWMDDMHDYCNVSGYEAALSETQTGFNHAVREFRHANPWLQGNLKDGDLYDYRKPVDGSVLFTTLRHAPNGDQVFCIAHLEGGPVTIDPLTMDIAGLEGMGWDVALRTPPIGGDFTGGELTISDSMGVLYTRPAARR